MGQSALDAPIAPIPVLFGYPCHHEFDLPGRTRSPRPALAAAIVSLSDQLAMPGQQSLGRDDGGDLHQQLPSQAFGLGGQSSALIVGEPQSTSGQLFSQNAILLTKVVNSQQLMLVHPTSNGDE
jgi:hypothetical protein